MCEEIGILEIPGRITHYSDYYEKFNKINYVIYDIINIICIRRNNCENRKKCK